MPRTLPLSALLLTSISVFALSACSSTADDRQAKSTAPMPPISEMDAAMSAPAPAAATLSDSDTLTPVMPTATASGDIETRMAKLEQSVGSLRSDYDKIMPAFATLNTTNERIQTLLNEIEKETGTKPGEVAVAPVATTPPAAMTTMTDAPTTTITTSSTTVPAIGVLPPPGSVSKTIALPADKTTVTTTTTSETVPVASAPPLSAFQEQPTAEEARAEAARQTGAAAAPAKAAATTPASTTAANSVKGVRIGEHDTKTRLVIDLGSNSKPDFKYDLDNAEKLLLVELPSSSWAGAESGAPKSPLIASWSGQNANGGSTLTVQLKKSAKVVSSQFLKAEAGSPARIVLDIAQGG